MSRVWIALLGLVVMMLAAPAAVAETALKSAGPHEGAARAATAAEPRLLVSMWCTEFAVRPKRIVTTGDGSSYLGLREGKGGAIRWSSWSRKGAKGVGIFWANDFDPNAAQGTLYPHRATVKASRVVKGRYTRLTIRFRSGESWWEDGDILHVLRYRLAKSPECYAWR